MEENLHADQQTDLRKNLNACREIISAACLRSNRNPADVHIVGASKTHPPEMLRTAFEAGLRDVGENYVQEMLEKTAELTDLDLRWHFIGHLQSNKVRSIVPFVSYIHSVDSLRLAKEISKEAQRIDRTISILLQVNSSAEASKSGVPVDEAIILARNIAPLPNLKLCGLMSIPEPQEDPEESRPEFQVLSSLRRDIQSSLSLENFNDLSMGMSSDFECAVEEGATFVRLGTILFGAREYSS